MAEPRTYRRLPDGERLVRFGLSLGETDLQVGVDRASARPGLPEALAARIADLRAGLLAYIAGRPLFRDSFEPLPDDRAAPPIARSMLRAARAAGVGPMAAVAGAFADAALDWLLGPGRCREAVVENGGDLALSGREPFSVVLLAGASPLSGRLLLELDCGSGRRGLATSSGRVGHSYSAGRAEACAVLAADGAAADAFATAFANRLGSSADLEPVLEAARLRPGVLGLAAVVGERFGCVGALRLAPAPAVPAGAAAAGGVR